VKRPSGSPAWTSRVQLTPSSMRQSPRIEGLAWPSASSSPVGMGTGHSVRAALVSTFPPRPCGIGTFAADLRAALIGTGSAEVDLVAVVHEPSSPQRRGLLATIAGAVRGDYARTARMLGRLDVDVVLLQHEYGIFGGRDGEYVLSFARELTPAARADTAHRPLRAHGAPGGSADRALRRGRARHRDDRDRPPTARRLGRLPEEKVRVVPHGAPARLIARAAATRDARAGADPRHDDDGPRLSTFGLISSGKGIETVIDALPALVDRHPGLVYTIAGRTHPDVERREGERYRLMLERHAFELGLGTHVLFDDRFVSVDELAVLLGNTDIFLTPYAGREQIASGALTFALAAGCAVVSTSGRSLAHKAR